MRLVCITLLVGGCLLAAGCAQRTETATLLPHHGELPNPEHMPATQMQATVRVEGRAEEPLLALAPVFTEPELTPEERAAVGEDTPEYRGLSFNYLVRTPGTSVATWYAGTSVHTAGRGGATAGSEALVGQRYGVGSWGGTSVGIHSLVRPRGYAYREEWRTRQVGPDGSIQVGFGPASHVSSADTGRQH